MNINMVDTTEKIENSELVTNRDQLVVVDNIESLIKVIRGQQVIYNNQLVTICDQFAILCLYYYICHIYINYQNHNL
jgi:hypothetical protein